MNRPNPSTPATNSPHDGDPCVFVPDGHPIDYCVGVSAFDGNVENRNSSWADFVRWLTMDPEPLGMTLADYFALSDEARKVKKDGEVFIAGRSLDGRRDGKSFTHGSMLIADIDKPAEGFGPDVNRKALTALWSGACPVLSGTEFVVHLTTSSRPDFIKFHLLVPLREPVPVDKALLANTGLLLAMEAAHEGLHADRSGLARVRPFYRPKLAADVVSLAARRNRGSFPDVEVLIAIATEHATAEAAAKEATRKAADDERRGAHRQREQAQVGGYKDDSPAIQTRWREVLDGIAVHTEPIRASAAGTHVLCSGCPTCGPDRPIVDWTAEGLWKCRDCVGDDSGGGILRFVKLLEGIDGNAAFARCRELLGIRSHAGRGAAFSQQADEEWGEPEPLPEAIQPPTLVDDYDGRRWRDAALPPDLANYVASIADSCELPPEVPLVGALVTAAMAIGPDVLARGGGEHRETLSVWAAAVLPSGGRKSAGLCEPTKALAKLEDLHGRECSEKFGAWKARETERTKRESAADKKLAAHYEGREKLSSFQMQSARDEITAVSMERDNDPEPGRFELVASNATPEAVAERVASNRSFALVSAEGATVLLGVSEYRTGSDSSPVAQWCAAYSGDRFAVARRGRAARVVREKTVMFSLGITIQPTVLDEARASRTLVGQGALARFLLLHPQPTRLREGQAPGPRGDGPARWWEATIDRIVAQRPGATAEVRCGDGAIRALRFFERECCDGSLDEDRFGGNEETANWARRAHGHALRFAAIFHLIDGRRLDEEIGEATMERAITLARLGLASVVQTASARPSGLRRLGAKIRDLPEVTPRLVARMGWGGFTTSETAREALRELGELGWCREYVRQNPAGGPKQSVFVVNPRAKSLKTTRQNWQDSPPERVSSVLSGQFRETQTQKAEDSETPQRRPPVDEEQSPPTVSEPQDHDEVPEDMGGEL